MLNKAKYLYLLLFVASVFAGDWTTVEPADLAAKSPKVDKDAHAEAILWEVRVSDEVDSGYPRSVFTH